MTSVALLVAGSRQVLAVVQDTVFGDSIEQVIVALRADLAQGWTFFLFAAALLTMASNFVINGSKIQALATEVGEVMQDSTLYAQLYLRLAAGQPVDKNIPGSMEHAAVAQALDLCQSSRLQSFALFTLSTMVLMTVSIIKPIVESALEALIHLVTLPELRSWPVPWSHLGTSVKEIFASMGGTVLGLVSDEVSSLISKPMAAAFQLSTFVSILVVSFIPTLEHRTKVRTIVNKEDEEDEILSAAAFGTVATLSSLGVSSASRLGLLSKSGALEGTLERWRATLPPSFSSSRYQRSIVILLRRLVYTAISSFILFVPFFVHFGCFAGVCAAGEGNSSTAFHFDSILDVSILLLFALRLSWQSIAKVMDASAIRPYVLSFVKGLGEVVEEVSGSQTGVQSQLGCSISPTLGLSVKDLWAAHTSKRAWAVRGASFECHSGEVVAILGEDGAGKSRLLTAVAEALVFPVKRSLTTTKVRGVVSHSGLDASKWNRDQLKKRLGIFLNDVRTIADNADFMSGFTVEEMLEPLDALLTKGKSQQRAASRAVSLALQITGLSTSLLPRLPLKLATAVTANENELTPSELRPRCYALSPSEWSKVMLTRVLAQTLFDNNAVSGSPLVGSILLLDDLTAYMSELDEVRIIQALRKSGAATIFTTQKWASGRLADRIVVMKDGAVVESGSHGELLARGPQQSLYAAKWHAMTAG
jgi:ABC-type multidrug transport system fused ATPase/permease subunit